MKKAIFLIVLFISHSLTAADIPFLSGRINDYAGILSSETIQQLTDTLKLHDEQTGNEIVVLTISSLEGENIEDFSNRVFNEWKLGKKDQNNGLLLLIVPEERKLRIEVGYGLEDKMTDLMSKRIILENITPYFKAGNYDQGVQEGVSKIIFVLNGGVIADSDVAEDNSSVLPAVEGPDLTITEKILFGCFIFGIIGLFTVMGVINPGVGWFLYIFLIPFWAMFPIIIVGTRGALICLISYLILFPLAKLILRNKPWYKKARNSLKLKGHASIGGFSFSSSGSSGSSWSSGSSSFSGGGGSSGGGGASGSW